MDATAVYATKNMKDVPAGKTTRNKRTATHTTTNTTTTTTNTTRVHKARVHKARVNTEERRDDANNSHSEGDKGHSEGDKGFSKDDKGSQYNNASGATPRTMSQYEATALLALRTQQLAMGCRSTLADAATAGKTPQQIAQLELDCNAVPIVVSRVLPDGSHHDIPARWLRVPGDFRP